MVVVSLFVQQIDDCTNLLIRCNGIPAARAFSASQEFATLIRKQYAPSALPSRGQVVVSLTLRVLYCVLGEVFVAVVAPVTDNPFETTHALDRARSILVTAAKGINVTTAIIKKKFAEMFLSFELVMLGYEGVGGLSQNILYPTVRPAPPTEVAKMTIDFVATAAEFEKAFQDDVAFADVSFSVPDEALAGPAPPHEDLSAFLWTEPPPKPKVTPNTQQPPAVAPPTLSASDLAAIANIPVATSIAQPATPTSTTTLTSVPSSLAFPTGPLQPSQSFALNAPIADISVMVTETISGECGGDGAATQVTVTGEIIMAKTSAAGSAFQFKLTGAALDKVLANPECVQEAAEHGKFAYTCTVPATASQQAITLLKYRITSGLHLPVSARATWDITPTLTTMNVKVTVDDRIKAPIEELAVLASVNGNVSGMDTQPQALWSKEKQKALWKLPTLSQEQRSINLTGKFITTTAATRAPIAINFKFNGQAASTLAVEAIASPFATCKLGKVVMRAIAGQYAAI